MRERTPAPESDVPACTAGRERFDGGGPRRPMNRLLARTLPLALALLVLAVHAVFAFLEF